MASTPIEMFSPMRKQSKLRIAIERDQLKAINAELLEALKGFVDPMSGKIYAEFERMIRASHRRKIESAIAKAEGK